MPLLTNRHKTILLLGLLPLLLASCHSKEKVIYFQDNVINTPEAALDPRMVKIEPGDKISISVSSSDPELASVFNLIESGRNARRGTSSGGGTRNVSTNNSNMSLYTVNDKGDIDFPILGAIHVEGLTRQQITELIKQKLIDGKYVTDPVVTVEFANLHFSIIGDISSPNIYSISDDNINIIEALAMAGDLTDTSERDQIYVIRNENGIRTTTQVDIRSKEIFNSPAYYLKQNDIIYVVPNTKRAAGYSFNESTFRSWGFWTGLFGLATSITAFVVALSN